MRKIILILLLLVLSLDSCQYFSQVPNEDELLKKELGNINWNQVDELPSFPQCDSVSGKELKKQCFFDYMTQLIQQKLSADTLAVLYPKLDTIDVKVTVLADASLTFEPHITDSTSYSSATIDSILKSRLVDFPKIHPAIKRGIPVKTQFVLPVILNIADKN